MVADVGDGWYELVLTTKQAEPLIQISIGDVAGATGKPKEIDVSVRPPIVTSRPPSDSGAQPADGRDPSSAERLHWLYYVIAILLFLLVLLLIFRFVAKR